MPFSPEAARLRRASPALWACLSDLNRLPARPSKVIDVRLDPRKGVAYQADEFGLWILLGQQIHVMPVKVGRVHLQASGYVAIAQEIKHLCPGDALVSIFDHGLVRVPLPKLVL